MENNNSFYPHLSVDCVLLGFDGSEIKVLLVERTNSPKGADLNDMKLPGRLIYENEDLDEAANSVLKELTGLSNLYLSQFRTFGSPTRTSNPRDVMWLENAVKLKIGRLVTVAYMSMIKITDKINNISPNYQAKWVSLKDVPELAFDHNVLIEVALKEVQKSIKSEPIILFNFLPVKFTALQLRTIYEQVFNKKFDVRNFHKKMTSMPYVVATDELEANVAHRAARLYRFDKKEYTNY